MQFSSSTAATANGGRELARCGRRDVALLIVDQVATTAGRPRPRLPVRAAEARAPRLHGAEGDRDGRGRAGAGADAAHHAARVNLERMRANAIEAAEQCGILRIPEVVEPRKLEPRARNVGRRRAHWSSVTRARQRETPSRRYAPNARSARRADRTRGRFRAGEREALLARPFVVPIALGPRIMRADTAAVAALALVNSVLGDWR